MQEISFRPDPLDLSRAEIWRAMGYGDAVPEEDVRRMVEDVVDRVLPLTEPRYMFDIVDASRLSPSKVLLGGVEFSCGPIIGSYLRGMTQACVFVATAGTSFADAVRNLDGSGDIVLSFVADALGSVLAETAVSELGKRLAAQSAVNVSLPYSPGYCGWDIREQKAFFSLFPAAPCGVTLSDSCLMSPEKSVSGFFALGSELVPQPYRCDVCGNPNCFKRR